MNLIRRPMEMPLAVPHVKGACLTFTTRRREHLHPRRAALPLESGDMPRPLRRGGIHRSIVTARKESGPKMLKRMGLRGISGTPGGSAPHLTFGLPGPTDVLATWPRHIGQPGDHERSRLGRVLALELLARTLPPNGGRSTPCAE